MTSPCPTCETVSHCASHGCIPVVPCGARVAQPAAATHTQLERELLLSCAGLLSIIETGVFSLGAVRCAQALLAKHEGGAA